MAIEIAKMEAISGLIYVSPPLVSRSQRLYFVVFYLCVAAFCREVFTANAASNAFGFLHRNANPARRRRPCSWFGGKVQAGFHPINESIDPRAGHTGGVSVAGIEQSARRDDLIYGRVLATPIPLNWNMRLHGGGFSIAEAATGLPQATQEAFQQIQELVYILFSRFPRSTSASRSRRALHTSVEREPPSRENELVASALPILPHRRDLGMLKPLFESRDPIRAKSAFYGKLVDVTAGDGGLVVRVDGTEMIYTPFLVCHDHDTVLDKEAIRRMEEVLAGELCIADACSLDWLESLQHQHHLLTTRDVILFQGDIPFLHDSTGICALAALLVDHTVSDLSLILPVQEEPFVRRDAMTAELIRFALFYKVSGIVASLAASDLVLPRYSLQSFLIKPSGSVYLKSVPPPRRDGDISRRLALRFSYWDILRRSSLRGDFNKSMNALDLVCIAYNIWCLTRKCLLRFIPEVAHAKRRILAALQQSNSHLPRFVLKLLKQLILKPEVLSGLLRHPVYKQIGSMVNREYV